MKRMMIVAAVVGLFTTMSPSVYAGCEMGDVSTCNQYEDSYGNQRSNWQDDADRHQEWMEEQQDAHYEAIREQEEYERDERRHREIIGLLEALE